MDGKAVIDKYTGIRNSAIIVPNKIDNYMVIGIADNAFRNNENFTSSVEISHGIEHIGKSAFSGCKNLEYVVLPSTIKSIGDLAFSECENLEEVKFLGDLPKIGNSIFLRSNTSMVVLYYATNIGWDVPSIDNRVLKTIDEDVMSIDEDEENEEDGARQEYDGDEFAEEAEEMLLAEREIEEDLFKAPEVEYKAELKAFERTGMGVTTTTSLKNVSNPREAFAFRLTAFFDKYGKKTIRLSNDDLQTMLDPLIMITHIEFKNPIAFLLGYAVTKEPSPKSDINIKLFDTILSDLDTIAPNEEIVAADILRYAFYWRTVLRPLITH